MKCKTCVVKRHGKKEEYDEKKVYASVYAACVNCHYSEKKAEMFAKQVAKKVSALVHKKGIVDSLEIREYLYSNISDPHVLLMYKHHLDVC